MSPPPEPPPRRNGMLPIPDRPGLGIEIDLDALWDKARGCEDYGE